MSDQREREQVGGGRFWQINLIIQEFYDKVTALPSDKDEYIDHLVCFFLHLPTCSSLLPVCLSQAVTFPSPWRRSVPGGYHGNSGALRGSGSARTLLLPGWSERRRERAGEKAHLLASC